MNQRGFGGRGLLALGGALAGSGPLAKLGTGVAALTTFGTMTLCFVVAPSDKPATLLSMPGLASSALAWGAGVLVAFAASAHAFRRDREQGIRALVRARGQTDTAYLWSRVAGLGLRLLGLVGGGTLAVGALTILLARSTVIALHAAEATGAAFVFAVVFGGTLAPLAIATLGARSRAGGYVLLVVLLAVPELVQGWSAQMLPAGWGELASIPGALLALRGGLNPQDLDPMRVLRAGSVLALIVAIALVLARAQLARADAEGGP
jgi:hypothetical protein